MPENQPLIQEPKRASDGVADITAALDALQDHGFIAGWRREGKRWVVQSGASYGPYTTREIFGFVEGARAMGAGV